MAVLAGNKYYLWDPYVEINGNDYSKLFKSGSFNLSRAQLDAAAGGDDTELKKLGLRQIQCSLQLFQDYTAAQLDELLFALWNGEGSFVVKIRQSKTNVLGPANPSYEFSAVLPSFDPIKGQHGAMIMTDVVLAAASGITRKVA